MPNSAGTSKPDVFSHVVVPMLLVGVLIVPFMLPHWILGAGVWEEFSDIAHFVSFGFIALLGLWVLRPLSLGAALKLGVFLLGLAVLATSTEIIQHYFHADRDGSIADVIRNGLGAACFIALFFSCTSYLALWQRALLLVISALLLAWAMKPLFLQWQLQQQRHAQLPVLYDFDEAWEAQQVEWTHAQPLHLDDAGSAIDVLKPRLYCPETQWSGIRMKRVWPHWSDYGTLVIHLHADMPADEMPFQVYVTFVEDFAQLEPHWGIAYTVIHRGNNRLTIPFTDIEFNGAEIPFHRVRVQFVDFYKPENQPALTLSLERLALQ